jgi:hypothetical protein
MPAMKTRSILPLALAAVAVAAPAASAAPTPKLTKYTYKAELKGKQTMTWSLNHVGSGGCDPSQTGSGKEVIRFTTKPTTIYTYDGLGSQPFFFQGNGSDTAAVKLKLRGTVNRQGTLDTEKSDCPNGGGGTSIPRDCGVRKIARISVAPQYEYKGDRMILSQGDASNAPDFRNCPAGGSTWPYLLREDDSGKSIGQDLPQSDLFGQGKNILIAKGTSTYDAGELKYTNKIRWELSLTRIKKEKVGDPS